MFSSASFSGGASSLLHAPSMEYANGAGPRERVLALLPRARCRAGSLDYTQGTGTFYLLDTAEYGVPQSLQNHAMPKLQRSSAARTMKAAPRIARSELFGLCPLAGLNPMRLRYRRRRSTAESSPDINMGIDMGIHERT